MATDNIARAIANKISNQLYYRNSDINNNGVEIIAHRGFMTQYPDNTIYSAQKAIELGAMPECDVQFTSDGYMVIMHDDTVDRTTNGTGTVSALTYSYLASLDAGSKFNSIFAGIHVPLFTDYLTAVRDAKHIYPELKAYRTNSDITTFVTTLINYGYEFRTTIQSFAYADVLPIIRQVSKKIKVAALIDNQTAFDRWVTIAKNDGNSMFLISTDIATSQNLQTCNSNNIDVGVWTVDDVNTAQSLINIGFRKLISSRFLKAVR